MPALALEHRRTVGARCLTNGVAAREFRPQQPRYSATNHAIPTSAAINKMFSCADHGRKHEPTNKHQVAPEASPHQKAANKAAILVQPGNSAHTGPNQKEHTCKMCSKVDWNNTMCPAPLRTSGGPAKLRRCDHAQARAGTNMTRAPRAAAYAQPRTPAIKSSTSKFMVRHVTCTSPCCLSGRAAAQLRASVLAHSAKTSTKLLLKIMLHDRGPHSAQPHIKAFIISPGIERDQVRGSA